MCVRVHVCVCVCVCVIHAQVEGVVTSTKELKEMQERSDPPEALQCIPTLKLSDIPKEITKVSYKARPLPAGHK